MANNPKNKNPGDSNPDDLEQTDESESPKPARIATLNYSQFMEKFKTEPHLFDTAHSRIIEAIKQLGEVVIEDLPEWRRPYARQLKALGIPNYKAYEQVRGSQRWVDPIVKHIEAGAHNGFQLRQLLNIVGGPGGGKTLTGQVTRDFLQGQVVVYAVRGCPANENPVNLLKLLSPEDRRHEFEKYGLGKTQEKLLKVARDCCPHCWRLAMQGKGGKQLSKANLENIQVDAFLLSRHDAGICTWIPSAGSSLAEVLRRGNRGVVFMPEVFADKTPETDLLLTVTNDRRLFLGCDEYPFDAVLWAESNPGYYERFLAEIPPKDRGKYTGRIQSFWAYYNTSRSEEIQTYLDFLEGLKASPHRDPLVLTVLATLAVASRMKKESPISLSDRIRMYDGEQLVIENKPQSSANSEDESWESIFSGSAVAPAPRKYVSVVDLWQQAGVDEGMVGLSPRLMLNILGQASELAMKTKHKGLSSIAMLKFLRRRIERELKTAGLNPDDIKVLENCQQFLKEPTATEKPGVVVSEFCRLLRDQMISVFCPSYEQLAQKDFEDLCEHAKAASKGDATVYDPVLQRDVEVNLALLNEIESAMGLTTTSAKDAFRSGLHAELTQEMEAQARRFGDNYRGDLVTLNWRTLPNLRRAIEKRLNDNIASKIESLLSNKDLALDDAEKAERAQALSRFKEMGFECESCRKEALSYFKAFKLWSSEAKS